MSMISELVKGLRKLGNQWKHNDVAGFNLIFDAADTIETLSEKVRANNLHNGWIPVSERLPDVDVEVLATVDWPDVQIAWLKKGGTWETDEYILANDEILAWMPLPEPYREDVDGGEEE